MDKFKSDIKDVYSFFSHNIRTFNSEIVTTVECFRLGFIDENDSQSDTVYEAAYLLDLYDTAFNICLNYLLGEMDEVDKQDCDIKAVTNDLLKNIKGFLVESNLSVNCILPENVVTTDMFIFKNIYRVMLYEIIKISKDKIVVNSHKGTIHIISQKLISNLPSIFDVFSDVFDKIGIKCNFDNNIIQLEFV